jgi:hypothetical protein
MFFHQTYPAVPWIHGLFFAYGFEFAIQQNLLDSGVDDTAALRLLYRRHQWQCDYCTEVSSGNETTVQRTAVAMRLLYGAQ